MKCFKLRNSTKLQGFDNESTISHQVLPLEATRNTSLMNFWQKYYKLLLNINIPSSLNTEETYKQGLVWCVFFYGCFWLVFRYLVSYKNRNYKTIIHLPFQKNATREARPAASSAKALEVRHWWHDGGWNWFGWMSVSRAWKWPERVNIAQDSGFYAWGYRDGSRILSRGWFQFF